MAKSLKPKLNISTGMRLGLLRVGDYVLNVQDHPLFADTPVSYLQQGKLRECVCDCGQVRLFADSILARNTLRSCGCVRAKQRAEAAEGKLERMTQKIKRKQINQALQLEQQRLRIHQMKPVPRDEQAMKDIAARIRALYAQKKNLTRLLGPEQ